MTFLDHELRQQGVSEDVIRVRRMRRDLRLTQAQAAQMLGLSSHTYLRMETGYRRTRPDCVGKAAEALSALKAECTQKTQELCELYGFSWSETTKVIKRDSGWILWNGFGGTQPMLGCKGCKTVPQALDAALGWCHQGRL